MAIQEIIVFALIALATAYWLRGLVRTGRGSTKGCGSGCGKCAAPTESKVAGRIGLQQI